MLITFHRPDDRRRRARRAAACPVGGWTALTGLLLVLAARPVQATPFVFVGPRPVGMGGAGVAATYDSEAVYWNPSNLTWRDGFDIRLSGAVRSAAVHRAGRGEWRVLLHSSPLRRLLAFSIGAYIFLQGPMQLFPLFVRERGGDLTTVGHMWIVMLLLEIPLVALSGAGLRRLGPRGLLAAGVLAGGVRWLVCALSDDLAVLYPIQLLHGVVVAGLLLGAPLYLELIVPERLRSTGQGLLATAGVGLGGILSNASCGWLIDHIGIDLTYAIGGIGGIALGAAVPWILPQPHVPTQDHDQP